MPVTVFLPQLLYPAPEFTCDVPAVLFRKVSLQVTPSVRIAGWWIPHPNPRATLIFWHGNAESICHNFMLPELLEPLRLNICMFDYRGYGESSGRPSQRTIVADSVRVHRSTVRRREAKGLPIIVYGRSIGGAVALQHALHAPVSGLFLEAAFSSLAGVVRDCFPSPLSWLRHFAQGNPWDSAAAISQLDIPIVLAHSTEDEVIPFSHAECLAQAAAGPCRILKLRGSHNDLHLKKKGIQRALNDLIDNATANPSRNRKPPALPRVVRKK